MATTTTLFSSNDRRGGKGLRVLGSGRETTSFRNLLGKNLEANQIDVPKSTEPIQTPAPRVNQASSGLPGIVKKIFSLFHAASSESRKLRLIETVSLGEKRFVALIQADGKSFLIGGCSAGVSLLSRLDNPAKNISQSEHNENLLEIPE